MAEYRAAASVQARRAAVAGVAQLVEGTPLERKGRELAEVVLEDRDFRVRMDAAAALARLHDPRSVEPLERALRRELDGRTKRRLRDAIADLHEQGRPAAQARKLGEEVERLRIETRKLRERLDRLEGTTRKGAPAAGAAPEESAPRRPRPRVRRASKAPRRKR
jgi:aminopeptidase N